MTLQRFVTLVALYLSCFAVVALAAMTDASLYVFVPVRHLGRMIAQPPTPPFFVGAFFVIPLIIARLSLRHALKAFTVLACLVLASTLIGPAVFSWTPSWAQHVLMTAAIATAVFGWRIRDDLDD